MKTRRVEHPFEAAVVAARCGRERGDFGIRLERTHGGGWVADWAFRLPAGLGERERYGSTELQNAISMAETYPSCPYCRATSIWRCGACERVSCWDGVSEQAKCAHCGVTCKLSGTIDQLRGGADR